VVDSGEVGHNGGSDCGGEPARPGTRGAALLTGLAFGVFHDIAEAARASLGTIKIHEPDRRRAALHSEQLGMYRDTVSDTLSTFYAHGRKKSR
jgi:hypothetical protein